MLTPRTTCRDPKLFSTLCTARWPARGAGRGAAETLVLTGGLAGGARDLSARGRSSFGSGAERASGGASRTLLVSISPMPSPSTVISEPERANPGELRFAGRRRNMPSKSTIPFRFSLSRSPRITATRASDSRSRASSRNGRPPAQPNTLRSGGRIMEPAHDSAKYQGFAEAVMHSLHSAIQAHGARFNLAGAGRITIN